jgi:hypothetical protein
MKILSPYFFFLVVCASPLLVFAQEDSSRVFASIEKYTLNVEIDAEHHSILGEAQMQIRILKDSLPYVRLALASSMTLLSVCDSADKKLDVAEEQSASDTSHKEISVSISDSLQRREFIVLKVYYREEFDSIVSNSLYISPKEIFLSPANNFSWWPTLSPATNSLPDQKAAVLLDAIFPSAFVVVTNGEPDSMNTVGSKTMQRFMYKNQMPLKSCFVLSGSAEFTKRSITGGDSTFRCSLFYNPRKLSDEFAGTVLRQLRDAYSYFSSMTTPDTASADIRVVVVGANDVYTDWYSNNGLIIARNSYSYSSVDSIPLTSPRRNKWVHELARLFSLAATDSTFLFDAGWSEYLTTKFFLHEQWKDGEAQQQVRLDLLSRTLDFYPAQTLAQGHRSRKNEQAVYFGKGAYVFLMLEYVIGEAAFDSVARTLYHNFRNTPVTLTKFQQLCEEVYGSRLDWFFKEWIYQTGFPELILSTEIVQTNRGNYSLKATITQRGDVFTTPLDLVFSNSTRSITKRIFVERQDQKFEFILPFFPAKSELDRNYCLLRWVPRLRLLAHARTSVSYRVFDRDIANSEREANILIQLDPNNITGWNNIALFSLGKAAVLKNDLMKAEEYFHRASSLAGSEPTQLYSVLSLVRLGNVLEMEGKRDEAVEWYKLGVTLAGRNPPLYAIALFEAQKYLLQKFISSDDFWYSEY